MTSIYEGLLDIDRQLERCFDLETGEVDEAAETELLKIKAEIVANGLEKLCQHRVNLLASVNGLEAEEERLAEKVSRQKKKLADLEEYIKLIHLRSGNEKSIAGSFTVSTRKSTQVIVEDGFSDSRFIKTETKEKVDKKALKEFLTTGAIVQGAALQVNNNLVVK